MRTRIEYKSEAFLKDLKRALYTYPPNLLGTDVSQKKEVVIRREVEKKFKHNDAEYDMYDVQLNAIKTINDIDISQLLGWDEIVVPYFVEEYGKLLNDVKLVINEYKRLNHFSELKGLLPIFDLRGIKSCLYDDLTQLRDQYDLSIDVKELVKNV